MIRQTFVDYTKEIVDIERKTSMDQQPEIESRGSSSGQLSLKQRFLPGLDAELLKKRVEEKVAENAAKQRAKRIVKYEPTKMIWEGCVLYFRRSTDKQDTTIESQKTTCTKKAEELGLAILGEYSDEITGKSDLSEREGMSKMMKDIKPGQVLIVYSISRIARQIDVFYSIIKMLKENGCRVICCYEKLDSIDPHMEMIWAVHAAFAQTEREAISSRTKAALQTMKKNGLAIGRPRWGYEIDPTTKKLIPVPEIQTVIKTIIELRTEKRLSLEQIASLLDELGIPTPSGSNRWERRMVSVILTKELGKETARKYRKESGLNLNRNQGLKRQLKEDLDFLATQRSLANKEREEPESSDNESGDEETQEEENETKVEEVTEEVKTENTEPPIEKRTSNLTDKPLILLRGMLVKRRQEFGLTEEEIRALDKETIIEFLEC
jgi:DNA invertase Pin-like site-specific DNA recombinase